MKKYRVNYFFDGSGYVDIEATTKEEAEEKFFDGDFSDEVDGGENYNIENTFEL